MPKTTPEPRPRVANLRLRGTAGRLPATAYWPWHLGRDPPALVVLLHAADAGTTPASLCERAGVVVLAVRHRPDPDQAMQDSIAAVRWAADHAGELDADPARVLVAGTSAAEVAEQVRKSGWPHVTELPGDDPEQLVSELAKRKSEI
jgi:acetyl esterase/lipase